MVAINMNAKRNDMVEGVIAKLPGTGTIPEPGRSQLIEELRHNARYNPDYVLIQVLDLMRQYPALTT